MLDGSSRWEARTDTLCFLEETFDAEGVIPDEMLESCQLGVVYDG
jgi:hypothetical protein